MSRRYTLVKLLLCIGILILIGIGIGRKEYAVIRENAENICYACIGLE